MLTVTTRRASEATAGAPVVPMLYLSFALGDREWKLAFSTGLGMLELVFRSRSKDA